jgi:hypothetical protein
VVHDLEGGGVYAGVPAARVDKREQPPESE